MRSLEPLVARGLFGLGLLLPVLAGGNWFFLLEPRAALSLFIVAALSVSGLILTLVPRRDGPPPHAAAFLLIVLVCWWCRMLLAAPSGPRAIIELLALLCAALLYGAFSLHPPAPIQMARLTAGLVAGSLLTAVYGQYQFWIVFPRIASAMPKLNFTPVFFVNANFYNANCYASFVAAVTMLSIGLAATAVEPHRKYVAALAAVGLLATLLLTHSRSTIVILALALVGLGLLSGRFRRIRLRAIPLTALSISLVATAWALAAHTSFEELWSVGLLGRIAIWRAALAMIRDHWLTGVGLDQFGEFFYRYRLTDYYTRYPHNLLLEVFAETGILGIAALLGFLITALSASIRDLLADRALTKAPLNLYFVLAVGILLSHAMVDIDWHAPANLILLFVLLAFSGYRVAEAQCCPR